MNIIRIDTSDNLLTRVELEMDRKKHILEEKRETPGDQNVLELIDKLLEKQDVLLKDVHAIEINTGPGSFTGLKVGAAIANALSFSGSISVNGKQIGEIAEPTY